MTSGQGSRDFPVNMTTFADINLEEETILILFPGPMKPLMNELVLKS